MVLGASEEEGGEIGGVVEEREQGLGLGVAEAHVVFQQGRARGGQHEACEEAADERVRCGKGGKEG